MNEQTNERTNEQTNEQTNGNVGTENSTNGCDCSSTSIWGVLEVLALLVVGVFFIYIAYNCVVSYCTRKKLSKEKERRRFVEHMENRFRTPPGQKAIEMSPSAPVECSWAHVHVPEQYQNPPQNSPQQQRPQSSTFD